VPMPTMDLSAITSHAISVGTRIQLDDFDMQEAPPLARGLAPGEVQAKVGPDVYLVAYSPYPSLITWRSSR